MKNNVLISYITFIQILLVAIMIAGIGMIIHHLWDDDVIAVELMHKKGGRELNQTIECREAFLIRNPTLIQRIFFCDEDEPNVIELSALVYCLFILLKFSRLIEKTGFFPSSGYQVFKHLGSLGMGFYWVHYFAELSMNRYIKKVTHDIYHAEGCHLQIIWLFVSLACIWVAFMLREGSKMQKEQALTI